MNSAIRHCSPRLLPALALTLSASLVCAASPTTRMRPPEPDSGAAADRAIEVARTLRARLPATLLRAGPGVQRLVRERLARDPALVAGDLSAALEWLLPDGGRLPIHAAPGDAGCSLCRAEPTDMLLDAVIANCPALTRSGRGLELGLGAIAWNRDAFTEIPAGPAGSSQPIRRQEADPEFARLQVELSIAIHELESSEADSRADPKSFMAMLAVLLNQRRVNELHRALESTPAYRYVDAPPAPRPGPATLHEIGTLAATVILRDSLTGFCTRIPLTVTRERRSPLAPGPHEANVASAPGAPDAHEFFALAFDEFRAKAAVEVRLACGEAAVRRAAFETARGHGGEAFGWTLLARDCGVSAPAPSGADSVLAHLAEVPYAALPSMRIGSGGRPPRKR